MNNDAQKQRKVSPFPVSLTHERKAEFQNFAAQQGRAGADLLREAIDVYLGHRDAVWIRRPVWVSVEEWEVYRLDLALLAREMQMLVLLLLDLQRGSAEHPDLDGALAKLVAVSNRTKQILPW